MNVYIDPPYRPPNLERSFTNSSLGVVKMLLWTLDFAGKPAQFDIIREIPMPAGIGEMANTASVPRPDTQNSIP